MLILKKKFRKKILNIYLKYFNYYNYKLKIFIAKRSLIRSPTSIDKGTRINGSLSISGGGEVLIGKYCAMGENIRIITSNHNINYLNMQYFLQREIGGKIYYSKKDKIIIGNNVWIGDSVIILPNVSIGDGSIIGAGSVVTKNVPEYCVVAGNPAKLIKKRFSDDIIMLLKQINIWDWSINKMKQHIDIFNIDITLDEKILNKLKLISNY